ncbi:MAG: AAA family ATPase [Cryomorphaceae bacterium]|nr:AAA family ATPase [Cryomorphaceae bacterium]
MKKLKISHLAEYRNQNQGKEDFGKLIKDAFGNLQENSLVVTKSLPSLGNLVIMADKFKMSIDRAAIFTTVHCMSTTDIRLSERTITAFLKPFFQENSKLVRTQLREMQRIGLLERERYEGMHIFSIESSISEAIDNGDLDTIRNVGPIGLDAVLEYFRKKLLDHDHLGKADVNQFMDDIVNNNAQLNLIKYCNKKYFTETVLDAYLCIAVCVKSVFDNDAFNFSYLVNYINMDKNYIQYMRKEILSASWAPIAEGLIENAGGGMVDFNPELKLTSKGFDYFLKELDPDMLKFLRVRLGKINIPMIQPKEIQKVDLHFDEVFAQRMTRITELLKPASFSKYQANFPQNAKMKGLTLLFQGPPGTGKTEFALQLSKMTGRPIIKVEVTDFQSKWVGESERKLKEVFRDYKLSCQRMGEKFPILFFNECDQVIGRRVAIKSSVDQMTNALQNIILEEMETFNGILIGSTNMTKNMDEAFERRWVMKMQFESPNETAKIAIWKSAIKGLRQSEAQELVKRFNFTPGEIANISRRFVIENMLGLTQSRLQTLIQLCETEHYDAHASNKSIGFSFEKSFQQTAKAN